MFLGIKYIFLVAFFLAILFFKSIIKTITFFHEIVVFFLEDVT